VYVAAFSANSFIAFLALAFVAGLLLVGGLPPVFAAIHAICGSARRSMAIAIVLFSATLFGGGFGPLATGAISDSLTASYGPQGLRYSLMLMMSLLVMTGGFFYLFGREMPTDLED
jgi:MFS family permease